MLVDDEFIRIDNIDSEETRGLNLEDFWHFKIKEKYMNWQKRREGEGKEIGRNLGMSVVSEAKRKE